jgi:hypothetical protein
MNLQTKFVKKIFITMLITVFIIWVLCATLIVSISAEIDYQNQIYDKTGGIVNTEFSTKNVTIQVPFERLQTLNFSSPFWVNYRHYLDGTMGTKTLVLHEQFVVECILVSFNLTFEYFFNDKNEEVYVPFEMSEMTVTLDYDQCITTLNWTTTIKCSDIASIYGIPVPFWL